MSEMILFFICAILIVYIMILGLGGVDLVALTWMTPLNGMIALFFISLVWVFGRKSGLRKKEGFAITWRDVRLNFVSSVILGYVVVDFCSKFSVILPGAQATEYVKVISIRKATTTKGLCRKKASLYFKEKNQIFDFCIQTKNPRSLSVPDLEVGNYINIRTSQNMLGVSIIRIEKSN